MANAVVMSDGKVCAVQIARDTLTASRSTPQENGDEHNLACGVSNLEAASAVAEWPR